MSGETSGLRIHVDDLADPQLTGLDVVPTGDGNGSRRFVYLGGQSGDLHIEIMELNEIRRLFMDDIRKACGVWDGVGRGMRR